MYRVIQFRQNPHQIIADVNVLPALSIGLIRCFYKDLAHQIIQDGGCQFRQIRVLLTLADNRQHNGFPLSRFAIIGMS